MAIRNEHKVIANRYRRKLSDKLREEAEKGLRVLISI